VSHKREEVINMQQGLDRALPAGSEPPPAPEAETRPKRLVDVTGGGDMAGEPIIIQEILDEEVLVTGFKRRESQFEGQEFYLAIQVQHEGELKVFTTGSGPILDIFARLDPQALPLAARFVEKKGKKGRKYFTIV
jgi:hypothetical protein